MELSQFLTKSPLKCGTLKRAKTENPGLTLMDGKIFVECVSIQTAKEHDILETARRAPQDSIVDIVIVSSLHRNRKDQSCNDVADALAKEMSALPYATSRLAIFVGSMQDTKVIQANGDTVEVEKPLSKCCTTSGLNESKLIVFLELPDFSQL
ncbi:hypothetical protein PI124_g21705 [Phytophthora idaei]|nr:hypothetical protein PI125_g18769 [Phytophthora idaei]KAG3137603.1 hypothetical protein PI126_g17311 [Phytophthora idaei]KAG3233215.1 hypothetical protein PI124_g21705 [Phytophthora idaei]